MKPANAPTVSLGQEAPQAAQERVIGRHEGMDATLALRPRYRPFPHPPAACFAQPGVWSLELEKLWTFGRSPDRPRARVATLDLTQASPAIQAYRETILDWIDSHPDQDYFQRLERGQEHPAQPEPLRAPPGGPDRGAIAIHGAPRTEWIGGHYPAVPRCPRCKLPQVECDAQRSPDPDPFF